MQRKYNRRGRPSQHFVGNTLRYHTWRVDAAASADMAFLREAFNLKSDGAVVRAALRLASQTMRSETDRAASFIN